MKPAILAGSMAVPVEHVNVAALKKALTIKYQPMGAPDPLYLELSHLVGDTLHVPRQFGLQLCREQGIAYEDHTSAGKPVKFPKVPKPRDYQVEPLLYLQEACGDYYDYLFRARTGWGKTIGSLILASRIGVSTLVLVDQENLKDQWIEALTENFGFKLQDIGIIQGKTCDYVGKAVTIAMVQTLRNKRGVDPLFGAFGLLIVDEVHIIGAPTFSSVLPKIRASYRVGISATPKRRDGLQKVVDYHLGKVRVYIDDEHEKSSVYITEHDSIYSWYANSAPNIGRFINEIADDGSRNLLVADSACHLYETGRDVLVLSDRIEHLRGLMDLCYYLGVPQEDMGLYAGYNPVYGYQKDPKPARRPPGYTRKTEYTPVSLQLISKRVKKADLTKIKGTARIIFATYGMFAKGVDVPRLSGGVDATPRSQAEQVHGRVLRKLDGKKRPIWITIVDINSYRSVYSLVSRIKGYSQNNATLFKGDLEKGWAKCNGKEIRAESLQEVDRLKSTRIDQNSVGLNVLETREQQIRKSIGQSKDSLGTKSPISARLYRSTTAKVARQKPSSLHPTRTDT